MKLTPNIAIGVLVIALLASCTSTPDSPQTVFQDTQTHETDAEEEKRLDEEDARRLEEYKRSAERDAEREAISSQVDVMLAKEKERRTKARATLAEERRKQASANKAKRERLAAEQKVQEKEKMQELIKTYNGLQGDCGTLLKTAYDRFGPYEDIGQSRASNYISTWYRWYSLGYSLNLTVHSYSKCEWFESS